jgi:hypothetical protein
MANVLHLEDSEYTARMGSRSKVMTACGNVVDRNRAHTHHAWRFVTCKSCIRTKLFSRKYPRAPWAV